MLNETQKRTCQAIVNVFETGQVAGDYASVTIHPDDPGHLTYGRSQTTLASGNLALLLHDYCANPMARLAREIEPYLPRLDAIDLSLDNDRALHALLREAGGDPAMREVQDGFFDRVYWSPATRAAERLGIETALGTAVVYDSYIHGSWGRMRDRTSERHGAADTLGENAWIAHYVEVRADWLGNHSNRLLRRTVYRMEAFRDLLADGNWLLELPLDVRSVRINRAALDPAVRVSAQETEERLLVLRMPWMRGDDVRALQAALAEAGIEVSVDGIFGNGTDAAVRMFQQREGLTVDGKAGPATRAALALD